MAVLTGRTRERWRGPEGVERSRRGENGRTERRAMRIVGDSMDVGKARRNEISRIGRGLKQLPLMMSRRRPADAGGRRGGSMDGVIDTRPDGRDDGANDGDG